jgi:hypothetical protein
MPQGRRLVNDEIRVTRNPETAKKCLVTKTAKNPEEAWKDG